MTLGCECTPGKEGRGVEAHRQWSMDPELFRLLLKERGGRLNSPESSSFQHPWTKSIFPKFPEEGWWQIQYLESGVRTFFGIFPGSHF